MAPIFPPEIGVFSLSQYIGKLPEKEKKNDDDKKRKKI